MPGTTDWLGARARHAPDAPAVVDDRPGADPVVLTVAELDEGVNRLANALLRAGAGLGARVAWSARNATEVVVLAEAVRRIGASLVALNHQLRRDEAEQLLVSSRAGVLVVAGDQAAAYAGIERSTPVEHVVVFDGEPVGGQVGLDEFQAGVAADRVVAPDGKVLDPATPSYVGTLPTGGTAAFTGGTTGRPKEIRYDRGRLAASTGFTRIEDAIYGGGPHVFITSGSLSHGGPFSHALRVLAGGGSVVLQRRFDPVDWLRLVDRYRVTASYCAPTVIRRICELPSEVRAAYDLSSIRVVVAGAAKWSYALKLAYREAFPPGTLWELYGSTELGSNIVMGPEEHWDRPESCGRPADGYEIVLRDEGGALVGRPYERGVVYVKGPFVLFDGYADDPAATAAARWGDYWTVGDVAYADEDGYFYICDRSKDMYVSGGVNVYPAEVEAVLDACPGVAESGVVGVPDDEWGERGLAFVVSTGDAGLEPAEVLAFCRERVASYKLPSGVLVVDELPHTEAGKIDKRALRALAERSNA